MAPLRKDKDVVKDSNKTNKYNDYQYADECRLITEEEDEDMGSFEFKDEEDNG